jgi:hypothetical protein
LLRRSATEIFSCLLNSSARYLARIESVRNQSKSTIHPQPYQQEIVDITVTIR